VLGHLVSLIQRPDSIKQSLRCPDLVGETSFRCGSDAERVLDSDEIAVDEVQRERSVVITGIRHEEQALAVRASTQLSDTTLICAYVDRRKSRMVPYLVTPTSTARSVR
jgi:hypothetical protein